MVKDKSITDLKKEIKLLEERINKLEIKIKDVNNFNKKKIKDPNAPKNPTNAFIFFNKHKIEDYKKKNPDKKINVVLISKDASKEWKTLKDEEKDKYLKMSIKDKKRYEKEFSLYKNKT